MRVRVRNEKFEYGLYFIPHGLSKQRINRVTGQKDKFGIKTR
jgi:hypothetical protein